MKKKILFLCAGLAFAFNTKAQISQGGLPLSMKQEVALTNVPLSDYQNPDWESYLNKEKERPNKSKVTGPVKIGLHAPTDFGFPQSGQMITLDNGQRVWRGIMSIPGAPAIGLLFDQFNLPKGVKLYLTNENKKQVVGAFDNSNNDPSGQFAIDAIQGPKVYMELNIAPEVNLSDIKMHIDKALVFHRAIEHLQTYLIAGATPLDQLDNQTNGQSSQCNINAICPQGVNYPNPRKATVQTVNMAGGDACSGTLVTHTGNTAASCKPYIYTASHCESPGETNSSTPVFNQYLVRFNFERPTCDNSGATNGQSMMGVNLVARSEFQEQWLGNTTSVKGDFMLLELREAIPAGYGAVFSGWDRSNSFPTNVSLPKKFIGFHHPAADNKKLSSAQTIVSYEWPSAEPNPSGSRWAIQLTEGYVEGGSSGSGLFNGDGYLIGDASVAAVEDTIPANCKTKANGQANADPSNFVLYQKISHAWEYNENGIAGANSLKPFLDPANTGVLKINSVTQTCAPLTSGGGTETGLSLSGFNEGLDGDIVVYPNPSSGNNVQLQYNLRNRTDLSVTIVDITGKVVFEAKIKGAKTGTKLVNLQQVSSGMYVIKISSPNGYTCKKLVLNK
ncbi:hypothetical protein DBR32_04375 [Taibaiella sp. KBW10]|uniref:T9SS type A sorting domain-containing protein n=1 Tax=Taibaiella sp. KBW10 TaxID=2153357 RepID=UPI000F5A3677|nr:T9SS type A sorting domain-containing protein [Taibaiella sp. KBW10]RQO31211.1 hypothetical protein DBR32_04375 [Taibaiella sp. KBW10]